MVPPAVSPEARASGRPSGGRTKNERRPRGAGIRASGPARQRPSPSSSCSIRPDARNLGAWRLAHDCRQAHASHIFFGQFQIAGTVVGGCCKRNAVLRPLSLQATPHSWRSAADRPRGRSRFRDAASAPSQLGVGVGRLAWERPTSREPCSLAPISKRGNALALDQAKARRPSLE